MVIPLTTEKAESSSEPRLTTAEGREQEQWEEGTGWTTEQHDGGKQKQKEVKKCR